MDRFVYSVYSQSMEWINSTSTFFLGIILKTWIETLWEPNSCILGILYTWISTLWEPNPCILGILYTWISTLWEPMPVKQQMKLVQLKNKFFLQVQYQICYFYIIIS